MLKLSDLMSDLYRQFVNFCSLWQEDENINERHRGLCFSLGLLEKDMFF